MLGKQEKVRLALLFTTLFLLGTVLHLQYKTQTAANTLNLAASTNFSSSNRVDLSHLKNINYNEALKAYNQSAPSTGNPTLNLDQLKSIVSSLTGGSVPSCLGSVGSISVSHSLCMPPGPGKWTGQPKLPGTDMRPCPVSGTQGGSAVAVCLAGCCRAVSVTGPSGALSGFSQQQLQSMGILAQMLPTFLQQLMSQDSGASGGYYNSPYISNQEQTSDVTIIDSGEETVSNLDYNFDTYSSNYLNDETYNTYSSVVNNETESSLAMNDSGSVENMLETVLIKEENKKQQDKGNSKPEVAQPYQVTQSQVEDELQQLNEQEDSVNNIVLYTFQNLEDEQKYDPRVDELRDPTKSKVRQYRQPEIEVVEPATEKSWWEKLIDWLLGLN